MWLAAVALPISIAIAVIVLLRLRWRNVPETEPGSGPPQPRPRTRRQRKILEKLEPLPEIPTLMDLVREEIAETGLEQIPGHQGLSGPILLKVFKRDRLGSGDCAHEGYEYVVREGVDRASAGEDDVKLVCTHCESATLDLTPDAKAQQ